jgi:hypothetical protein
VLSVVVVWQQLMMWLMCQLSWLELVAEPELQHSQDAVVAVLLLSLTSAKIGSAPSCSCGNTKWHMKGQSAGDRDRDVAGEKEDKQPRRH